MKRKFIIWHDRDFDFALWVIENSVLKDFQVTLKAIPKTYSEKSLLSNLKCLEDFMIMPVIQFAGHDIVVQEILDTGSKILLASEFMTQTPQHDHVAQRFERIYKSTSLGVPSAFILPGNKTKREKDKNSNTYIEKKYKQSPIPLSIYVKTNQLMDVPSLMFDWPAEDGYLLYDESHPTAPKNTEQVTDWLKFLNSIILDRNNNLLTENYFLSMKNELGDFNFFKSKQERISEHLSKDIPEYLEIPIKYFPKEFFDFEKTYIFKFRSKKWRTTPYMGWACGYKRLFCEGKNGEKIANFIYMPLETKDVKEEFSNLDKFCKECPFDDFNIFKKYTYQKIIEHLMKGNCISTQAQDVRIISKVVDLLVLKDSYIFIND